jgi:hypothetical protein
MIHTLTSMPTLQEHAGSEMLVIVADHTCGIIRVSRMGRGWRRRGCFL